MASDDLIERKARFPVMSSCSRVSPCGCKVGVADDGNPANDMDMGTLQRPWIVEHCAEHGNIDSLRAELAERTRERDEAEKREHANRVSCEQNFALLTDEREAHKLAHSQWCAEREAHAATRRMVDELSMRGTRANFDTARELYETTKELSACIARAVAAERKLAEVYERVREHVAAHESWPGKPWNVHGTRARAIRAAVPEAFDTDDSKQGGSDAG